MKRCTILLSAVLILAAVVSAQASLINPSFETGDLSGWAWNNRGSASVTPYDATYVRPAADVGDNFLLLTAGPRANSRAGSSISAVSQALSVDMAQTISGWARLIGSQGIAFVIEIIRNDNETYSEVVWSSADPGTESSNGWYRWSLDLDVGDYTVQYSIQNRSLTESAQAGFDAPVPLPSAVFLLASGLLGLVAVKRKRSKDNV